MEVGVSFTIDFAGDRAEVVHKARIFERVLSQTANDYAKLALLVDGLDVTGELAPEDLAQVSHPDIPETSESKKRRCILRQV